MIWKIIATAGCCIGLAMAVPSKGEVAARSYHDFVSSDPAKVVTRHGDILQFDAPTSGRPLLIRSNQLIVSFPLENSLVETEAVLEACGSPGARVLRSIPGRPVYLVEIEAENALVAAPALETCLQASLPEARAEPNQLLNLFENQQGVLQSLKGIDASQPWQYLNLGHSGGTVDADADVMEALSRYLHARSGPRPQTSPVVAIADTGVATFHPQLAPALWINEGEIPDNGRDDDKNGFVDDVHGWNFAQNNTQLLDYRGHGTHVAGIVGARRQANFPHHMGVSPNSRLMVLKLLLRDPDDPEEPGEPFIDLFDSIGAIAYAADNGADVLNMSYGSYVHSPEQDAATADAFKKGVMLVAAAGNDALDLTQNPVWPCLSPYVFCVANSDRNDTLSASSNYSDTHSLLAAPGHEIWSTSRSDSGGYELKSGTSMAAPLVAGTLANLRSLNPEWTSEQIYARVMATADRPGSLRPSGTTGRLNVYRALYGPAHLGTKEEYCDQRIELPSEGPTYRWQNYPFANSGEPGIDGWSFESAFTICTQTQLLAMQAEHLDRFFLVKRDIEWGKDASWWNQIGAEVTTGGTINRPFNGVLDGGGHILWGLRSAGRPWAGLIAELGPRGIVTNLRMSGVDIKSHGRGGALATLAQGTIVNVQVEGCVSADMGAGGLVGEATGGRILNSYFEGEVISKSQAGGLASTLRGGSEIDSSWFQGRASGAMVGGLAGWVEQSKIKGSHANLVTEGSDGAGGLVGYQFCKSVIQDSYADGRISAKNVAGGLVGMQSDSSIFHSYATPFLEAKKAGGLVANRQDGIVTNYEGGEILYYCDRTTQRPPPSRNVDSYYDSVRIEAAGVDGIAKTTAQLQNMETFSSWPQGKWEFRRPFYPQLRDLARTQQATR